MFPAGPQVNGYMMTSSAWLCWAGRDGGIGRGQTNKIRRGASHLSTFQPQEEEESTGEVGGTWGG